MYVYGDDVTLLVFFFISLSLSLCLVKSVDFLISTEWRIMLVQHNKKKLGCVVWSRQCRPQFVSFADQNFAVRFALHGFEFAP